MVTRAIAIFSHQKIRVHTKSSTIRQMSVFLTVSIFLAALQPQTSPCYLDKYLTTYYELRVIPTTFSLLSHLIDCGHLLIN